MNELDQTEYIAIMYGVQRMRRGQRSRILPRMEQHPSATAQLHQHASPAGGSVAVTVMEGDGIGPEVVGAALRVMREAGARLDVESCRAGAAVFREGDVTGVPDDTITSIERTGVALKGPLATPIGHGEKSANVTLRKIFETYANIRPSRELPGVLTPFSGRGVDLVVIRENVEDLYAGIEHMQTPQVAQSLKVITRYGSEKVARLAFAYARAEGRRSITVATKANIMKLSEGLFQQAFDDVATEFPDIEARHVLVDNCAHQLVMRPEQYDIILTTNMNGDILSDLTSGLVGGLGFAPSANIGTDTALFEAVHGSAPDIAGRDVANPTAIMLSCVLLLRHIGQADAARAMEDAVLVTLEDRRFLTGDIAREHAAVGTSRFTDAVVENIGRAPVMETQQRTTAPFLPPAPGWRPSTPPPEQRRVIGVDVFLESEADAPTVGGASEACLEGLPMRLKMVSNRGTQIYPGEPTAASTVDVWRARFMLTTDAGDLDDATILDLLARLGRRMPWVHVEKLQEFDGVPAFTKAQGED